MKSILVSVPGKIHLLGEHSVVYGKPALLTAINKRAFIKTKLLSKRKKGIKESIIIQLADIKEERKFSIQEIINYTLWSNKIWEQFIKTKNLITLKSIISKKFDLVKIALGETFLYFRKNKLGGDLFLSVNSDIPIGAGLGSSSAIAAGVTGALNLTFNYPFEKKIINEIAYKIEQKQHGYPSGGDNSTVIYGGLLWFKKIAENKKTIISLPYQLPQKTIDNFFLIDTGKPQETTGEMVLAVKKLKEKSPEKINIFLTSQEKLVEELLAEIKMKKEDKFISIIRRGERNLEKIGVVSSQVKKIIRIIEKNNGAAKICGGGGKKKGTGRLLAYGEVEKILKAIRNLHLPAEKIQIGVEGIKNES